MTPRHCSRAAIAGGETLPVKVLFNPEAQNEGYSAKVMYSTRTSKSKQLFALGTTVVVGRSGRFDVRLSGFGEDNVWKIAKISSDEKLSNELVIANEGDTVVSMILVNAKTGVLVPAGEMMHAEVGVRVVMLSRILD